MTKLYKWPSIAFFGSSGKVLHREPDERVLTEEEAIKGESKTLTINGIEKKFIMNNLVNKPRCKGVFLGVNDGEIFGLLG